MRRLLPSAAFAGLGLATLGLVGGIAVTCAHNAQQATVIQEQRQQIDSLNAQLSAPTAVPTAPPIPACYVALNKAPGLPPDALMPEYQITGPQHDQICAWMIDGIQYPIQSDRSVAVVGRQAFHYKSRGCPRAVASNRIAVWSDDPDVLKVACSAYDQHYAPFLAWVLSGYLSR